MKDRCPSCGHHFGLRGAPFKVPAKGSNAKKPAYYCGACGIALKRIIPATERLASIVGYAALLVASSISIWQLATLSQAVAKDWLLILYAVSVVGIGVSIVLGLTRQHYFLRWPESVSVTSQAEVSKASE